MLKDYGVQPFYHDLSQWHLSTIKGGPGRYGLTLILGGAETKLWDLVTAYGNMARQVYKYPEPTHFETLRLSDSEEPDSLGLIPTGAGANWQTIRAMQRLIRPADQAGWEAFGDKRGIAWKTGTSYGFRDAWAVGMTPDYVVGVWVGNASGEGRPGITGIEAAAPLLFDVFNLLPSSTVWSTPYDALVKVPVCKHSGLRVSPGCFDVDTTLIPGSSLEAKSCTYCKTIPVSKATGQRVFRDCYSGEILKKGYFDLPPLQAWYYKRKHTSYSGLPRYSEGCEQSENQSTIRLIYPKPNSTVLIPVDFSGMRDSMVLEAACSAGLGTLYWHLDDHFLGQTTGVHKLAVNPEPGEHVLLITDEQGNTYRRSFTVEEP
jgi:penicillin-binding protein 1C